MWKKRCKKDSTDISDRKIWETKCGSYKVVFSHIKLGGGVLTDTYYAIRIDNNDERRIETILSKNRKKKHTAQKDCEDDFKKRSKQK